jgi:apolipoprotein N-acyltransferase
MRPGLPQRIAGLRGWRADAAAALAGALAVLALPPLHVVPALAISIPVLLLLIGSAPGPLAAARRGWWFGFGLYAAGLYWITEAILVEAERFWWLVPLAVPALAAVLAVFAAVPAAVAKSAGRGWPAALALGVAWTLADLARQFVLSGFPWNPLGSAWELPGIAGDAMIQPAAWVGVHGLTLATVLLAAVPLLGPGWRVGALAALAAWAGAGAWRLGQDGPVAPGVTVVLVQGNVAQGQKWDRALMGAIFERYLDLTRQAAAIAGERPAVIVWPETASPAQLQTDAWARGAIAEAAGAAQALVGSVRWDTDGRPRNSLFALGAGGAIEGVYDKWHLVPFGEYQPYWLPGIQIVPGGGFAPGPGPSTLHMPGLPAVGALICYEAIFSGEVVDPADRPAWLVNVTNDAWFGNSAGPRQHLAAVRLRAVESGLPVLRAANTGITAAFDPKGRELARLGMQETGIVTVGLPGALDPTIYGRFGLLLPGMLSAVVLGAGMTRTVSERRRRYSKKCTIA